MKSASPPRRSMAPGLTLLELSVVISVLVFLVALLMIGTSAWRKASTRTGCILNLRNVQNSVRAYQNLYGYNPGTLPYAENGTQSIADHLLNKGYISDSLHDSLKGDSDCPGGGSYEIDSEDVFPPVGDLYARCSLETSEFHVMPGDPAW